MLLKLLTLVRLKIFLNTFAVTNNAILVNDEQLSEEDSFTITRTDYQYSSPLLTVRYTGLA